MPQEPRPTVPINAEVVEAMASIYAPDSTVAQMLRTLRQALTEARTELDDAMKSREGWKQLAIQHGDRLAALSAQTCETCRHKGGLSYDRRWLRCNKLATFVPIDYMGQPFGCTAWQAQDGH